MTRGRVGALVVLALVTGLALRLARLDVRPMHHDEANQAVKFGALLEHGLYRYDAHDHHGPTLYYLALPAAWARGQRTLASLDERTLRGVTAVFGAATILLPVVLLPNIGGVAVATSAWLLALSPALVFYSRMFIQESLFACFTLSFAVAVGRRATAGRPGWWVMAGIAAGLAAATKETAVIMLPAALVACAISRVSLRASQTPVVPTAGRGMMVAALGTAAAIAALFYSSFLAEPGGLLEPFRAAATYLDRGTAPAPSHTQPWHYYIGLVTYSSAGGLTWSEGLVILLATAGAMAAWQRPRAHGGASTLGRSPMERAFWLRYLTAYVGIAAVIFSAIPYKTPWNLLPFYVGTVVLAGLGFAALVGIFTSPVTRGLLVAALAIGTGQLGWQAWRASVIYAADPRNPYVYAQTLPDTVRLANRIRDLAAVHPDGVAMQVSVIAAPFEQWPLPWYLRAMPHVGYWSAPGDARAAAAPVLVSSVDHATVFDGALGDRYVSEFYGLRPEVLLVLYVERGLWDRFLARAAGDNPSASCLGVEGCGHPLHAAPWHPAGVP